MQTAEPTSTKEDTELIVKILNSTYAKVDRNQLAGNSTQMDAE